MIVHSLEVTPSLKAYITDEFMGVEGLALDFTESRFPIVAMGPEDAAMLADLINQWLKRLARKDSRREEIEAG